MSHPSDEINELRQRAAQHDPAAMRELCAMQDAQAPAWAREDDEPELPLIHHPQPHRK